MALVMENQISGIWTKNKQKKKNPEKTKIKKIIIS